MKIDHPERLKPRYKTFKASYFLSGQALAYPRKNKVERHEDAHSQCTANDKRSSTYWLFIIGLEHEDLTCYRNDSTPGSVYQQIIHDTPPSERYIMLKAKGQLPPQDETLSKSWSSLYH